MRTAARIDSNQPEIVAALRKKGAVCILTHQIKNAFDMVVCFDGKIHLVEIKDGSKPVSARKLTKGELQCKSMVEGVGCSYNVITSVDEALNLIGF